jgi:hypothetical protein
MSLSTRLRRERTNTGTRATVTLTAAGVYKPPYGKTKITIGGHGTNGTPDSGGNYAGSNPGIYSWINVWYSTQYGTYNVPQTATPVPTTTYGPYTVPGGYSSSYSTGYRTTNSFGSYIVFTNNAKSYGPSIPASSVYSTYNGYDNTNQGNTTFTEYQTYPSAGYTPGPAYYNAYYSGSVGATQSILGVTFPGGQYGSPVTVSPTYVTIPYTVAGTPISVASGSSINIINT